MTTYNREVGIHDIPISPQKPIEINDCFEVSAEVKGCDARVQYPENMSKNLNSCFNNEHQQGKCNMNTIESTTEKVEVIPQSVSFQSASGKHIGISDAARKKAAGLLADLENNSDISVKPVSEKAKAFLDKEDEPTQNLVKDGSTCSSKKGDCTISGENAEVHKIHAEKLHASKEEFGVKQKESLTGGNIPQFVSFQSAGGKKIPISEKATLKAQQLMAEVSVEHDISITADAKLYRNDNKSNLKDGIKVSDGFRPFKVPKPASSTRKNCDQSLLNNVNTKDNFTNTVGKTCEANRESGRGEFSDSLDGLTSTQMVEVFLETDDDIAWTQISSHRSIEDDTSDGEIKFREEPRPTELNVADEPGPSCESREEVSSNMNKVETKEGGKPKKDQIENRINSSGAGSTGVTSNIGIGFENDSQWGPLEANDSLIRLTDDPTRSDVRNQAKIEDVEDEIGMQLDPKFEQDMEASRNDDANSLLNTSVKSPSFVTASGYAIMIQDESYGAAKQLFSDMNDDRECGEPIPLSPEEPGNTVKTCENELSTKEFEEKKIEGEELNKSKYGGSNREDTLEVGFCGFQTAGGQKVSVSEESLKIIKVDHTFCDSNENSLNAIRPKICDGDAIIGFQTARGKRVKISKESLAKVKDIFEEPYGSGDVRRCSRKTGDEEENLVDTGCRSTKSQSFVDFETATGRNVGVSEINQENVSEKDTKPFDDTEKQEADFANKKFEGFSTASGRKVSVSEEALKRVEGMFTMTENEECNVHMKAMNVPSVPLVVNDAVGFTGFQTAGGNKVTVAQESLDKTKNLFRDVSPIVEDRHILVGGTNVSFLPDDSGDKIGNVSENCATKETNEVSRESNNIQIYKGFQTASGSVVTVSKAILERTQNLLAHDKEDNTPAAPIFDGFTSASGKKIAVSDASLLNVKAVSQKYDHNAVVPVKSFTGFQTAGGSAVTVSENALQQAAKFHESVAEFEVSGLTEACHRDQCQDLQTDLSSTNSKITFSNVSTKALNSFTGFQTGRGQKVSVSEEALKKTRILTENDKYEDVGGDEQIETHFDIETEAKESTEVYCSDITQW